MWDQNGEGAIRILLRPQTNETSRYPSSQGTLQDTLCPGAKMSVVDHNAISFFSCTTSIPGNRAMTASDDQNVRM